MPETEDFQRAADLIAESGRILISTHVKPDGDACGSAAALGEALRNSGKTVETVFLSRPPEWYGFLFEKRPKVLGDDISLTDIQSCEPVRFDLIILVDTDSYSQMGALADYIKTAGIPVLVIDHHATSDNMGDLKLLDSSAAAAGIIVLDLFRKTSWPITKQVASSLFTAIAADTGWFRFTNADSRAYRAAAELIEAGADCAKIYRLIHERYSVARIKLTAAMLGTLEVHFQDRFVSQHISQRHFKATGAALADTENLVDECRRIEGIEGCALFVELPDGKIKCSFRSTGSLDVSRLAAAFGGGGHAMAAGATMEGPLEDAKRRVLASVGKILV